MAELFMAYRLMEAGVMEITSEATVIIWQPPFQNSM